MPVKCGRCGYSCARRRVALELAEHSRHISECDVGTKASGCDAADAHARPELEHTSAMQTGGIQREPDGKSDARLPYTVPKAGLAECALEQCQRSLAPWQAERSLTIFCTQLDRNRSSNVGDHIDSGMCRSRVASAVCVHDTAAQRALGIRNHWWYTRTTGSAKKPKVDGRHRRRCALLPGFRLRRVGGLLSPVWLPG